MQKITIKPLAELLVGLSLLCIAMFWSYWPTCVDLAKEWQRNQDYSFGQIVPFIAIYLAWNSRENFRNCEIKVCWLGVALIVLAFAMRIYGLLFLLESAQRYSLILSFAAIILLLLGKQFFYRAKYLLLFLLLMVPLPGKIHNAITYPLQSIATAGSVFVLELFGVSIQREGHVVLLNDRVPIAIAEACGGLRMLTAFIIISATLAALIDRPFWQKIILLISSVPIAIVCNLIRISVTAALYLHVNDQAAEKFFHDFAGITMMPMAVLILMAQVYLMKLIVTESPAKNHRLRKRIYDPKKDL